MFLWLGSCAVDEPCDGVEGKLNGLTPVFDDNLFWFSIGAVSTLMLVVFVM